MHVCQLTAISYHFINSSIRSPTPPMHHSIPEVCLFPLITDMGYSLYQHGRKNCTNSSGWCNHAMLKSDRLLRISMRSLTTCDETPNINQIVHEFKCYVGVKYIRKLFIETNLPVCLQLPFYSSIVAEDIGQAMRCRPSQPPPQYCQGGDSKQVRWTLHERRHRIIGYQTPIESACKRLKN